MSPLETVNTTLFLLINAPPGTGADTIALALLLANQAIALIPLLLLALWLWGQAARRPPLIKAFLVTWLAIGLNQVIGLVWPHPRPFALGLGHAWMAHAADPSFPSDHMTVFMAVGLSLLLEGWPAWGFATVLVGLGVAWSRIFLGVHFPLDMLGSVGVAGVSLLAVAPAWRRWGTRVSAQAQSLHHRVLGRVAQAGWIQP
jgi:undecaprenyl-diphosphatase